MIKTFKHKNDLDSTIIYINNVYDKEQQNILLNYLNNMNDFEPGSNNFGNVPRLQKWYQIDGEYFSKSWKNKEHKRWISKEYDKKLFEIQKEIEELTNKYYKVAFNSCLINKYRDGKDKINHHRDTQSSFGEYPVISNLSLGDNRNIEFKRVIYNKENISSMKEDKENSKDNFNINLESGSIIIMAGSAQKYFSHGIPETENNKLRYSLTFRNYI